MKGPASFPSVIGQWVWEGVAKDQDRWRYPSDWLADIYPQEFDFCVTYQIDNDQIQDRHQDEMDKDGFFGSDTNCDCCGKNIPPGAPYYRNDETQQGPVCQDCAEETKEEQDADRNSATDEAN